MSRVRTRLTKMDVKELYGFLYNGYKKEFFYWEVVIMYRKILMIVIAVIIKSYGVITQVSNEPFSNLIWIYIGTCCILDIDILFDPKHEKEAIYLNSSERPGNSFLSNINDYNLLRHILYY